MTMQKPAYLVASSIMPENHGSLSAYMEGAHPLFEKFGVEIVAVGMAGQMIRQFEGDWPKDASLSLFRFPSMDALLEFWNSPEYQAIKHLRTDVIAPHFTIGIEGE